ncbi:MAG: hypothetical protein HRT88_13965 [Lentisphaeraceae bacterium]|nr:hypothetical protein [Lentisphaeraceae bacterium]
MKVILLALQLSLLCSFAATPDTAVLDQATIAIIQEGFRLDDKTALVQNAVTNNGISSLILSHKVISDSDKYFTHTVPFAGIRNQQSSGRCWIFAGMNCLRTQIMKNKKKKDFKLSASYLAFWDKMEKANLFLERSIGMKSCDDLDRDWQYVLKESLTEGGWWNYVISLTEKYGVVPVDAMPETNSTSNSGVMNRIYIRFLKNCAIKIRHMGRNNSSEKAIRKYKMDCMKQLYRFLVINFGEPPKQFRYLSDCSKKDSPQYTEFTPQSFYKEYVQVSLKDYKCIFNNPTVPYNKYYSYRLSKAMQGAPDFNYINLPIGEIKILCKTSILNDEAIWFAADVSKDQDTKRGIMHLGLKDYNKLFDLDLSMTKAQRLQSLAGGANHAMVFVGMDLQPDGKVKKWQVENSWGTKKVDEGQWCLYDGWFNEHVYAVIINKKYLSKEMRFLFKGKATELEPWQP